MTKEEFFKKLENKKPPTREFIEEKIDAYYKMSREERQEYVISAEGKNVIQLANFMDLLRD